MLLGFRLKTGEQWEPREAFSSPYPLTIAAHIGHSQYPLNKWLLQDPETTTDVQPVAPAVADKRHKPNSRLSPLVFTQQLRQVWGTTAQFYEEHTLFSLHTCSCFYHTPIPENHWCLQNLLLEKQFQVNLKCILAYYQQGLPKFLKEKNFHCSNHKTRRKAEEMDDHK